MHTHTHTNPGQSKAGAPASNTGMEGWVGPHVTGPHCVSVLSTGHMFAEPNQMLQLRENQTKASKARGLAAEPCILLSHKLRRF